MSDSSSWNHRSGHDWLDSAVPETVLRAIPDCLNTPIIVLGPDQHVSYLNPACERIAPLPLADLLGQPIEAVLPVEGNPDFTRCWSRLWDERDTREPSRSGGTPASNGEARTFRTYRDVSVAWTAHRVESPDAPPYVLLSGRDITSEQQLKRELTEARELERGRLGRLLHDALASDLVAARMNLERLRSDTDGDRPNPTVLRQALCSVTDQVWDAERKARSLSHLLASETFRASNLSDMLSKLIRMQATLSPVDFHLVLPRGRLPSFVTDSAARHLFRIAQEAIRNAIAHGQPGRIDVSLSVTQRPSSAPSGPRDPERGSQLILEVRDDGSGFGPSGNEPGTSPVDEEHSSDSGIGLHLMAHRADRIGATLSIQSVSGAGTTVRCALAAPTAPPARAE